MADLLWSLTGNTQFVKRQPRFRLRVGAYCYKYEHYFGSVFLKEGQSVHYSQASVNAETFIYAFIFPDSILRRDQEQVFGKFSDCL